MIIINININTVFISNFSGNFQPSENSPSKSSENSQGKPNKKSSPSASSTYFQVSILCILLLLPHIVREWTSNNSALLSRIKDEKLGTQSSEVNLLGFTWDMQVDALKLHSVQFFDCELTSYLLYHLFLTVGALHAYNNHG